MLSLATIVFLTFTCAEKNILDEFECLSFDENQMAHIRPDNDVRVPQYLGDLLRRTIKERVNKIALLLGYEAQSFQYKIIVL